MSATIGKLVPTPSKVGKVGTKTVHSLSGGLELSSGVVLGVSIKALSTNSGDIYVGGVEATPYSGAGYVLEPGEALNLDVQNLNEVRVFAAVSGDVVAYGAVVE